MTSGNKRRLDSLRLGQGAYPGDSLRAAMAGLLTAWGCDADDTVLSVLLGDAFMLTHAGGIDGSSQWNIHGRHAFLAEAARDLGISLYDLHPPEAAPLPSPPPEYATHFRDSYAPFVVSAIQRDEPCLAWMGWPPPHQHAWGVITDVLEGGKCVGRTMFSGDETIAMSGPPVLVYIVNGVTPCDLDPATIIRRTLPRAAAVLNNRIDACYGVSTGTAALEEWRAAVQADATDGKTSAGELHTAISRQLLTGRKTAARFFMDHINAADARESAAMRVCCEAFGEMIECLTPFTQLDGCVSSSSTAYFEGLSKAIERALPFEQQAALALAEWIDA